MDLILIKFPRAILSPNLAHHFLFLVPDLLSLNNSIILIELCISHLVKFNKSLFIVEYKLVLVLILLIYSFFMLNNKLVRVVMFKYKLVRTLFKQFGNLR